jgi:integral membrane protein
MSATDNTTDEENPAQATGAAGVRGALARFRVMAYVVGVGLLALCAAMVLKYAFDEDQYVAIIGPVHGFLYIVYLVAVVDLGLKARWSLKGTILVMLAGVVPLVSFFVERRVTAKVRGGSTI